MTSPAGSQFVRRELVSRPKPASTAPPRLTARVSVAGARPDPDDSLRVDGVADTSVLVRVPVAKEAASETRARPAAPALMKPGKTAVACEPMVSVLTEVAKLLQPGRCVT